ncbi:MULTISPECIES: hypothetical protein [Pseudomonas]|jgi:hypothetical protein|uniref:hypothetical protein n=1 Tax=Pseudomonas TaxID=286 RepID=UPI0006E53E55|nr:MULTISPECIES: hypothetical protein [Pseudomonas]KPZ04081.1 hypothetical protein ALO85_200084 [Pseudomonas syringae pv. aptata]PBP92471.1 hypothetical protein CCL16_03235 [Pseudomonas syringae]PBP92539.1 hypothetical protein CCL16_03605 [Pseudomonas syringae]POP72803.1 hypothetical protein CXB37_25675 [Pseudomonas syringae pv. syringae]
MPNALEKARRYIKSIKTAVDIESTEGAHNTAWGYQLALGDFDLITQAEKAMLDDEASVAKKERLAELKAGRR